MHALSPSLSTEPSWNNLAGRGYRYLLPLKVSQAHTPAEHYTCRNSFNQTGGQHPILSSELALCCSLSAYVMEFGGHGGNCQVTPLLLLPLPYDSIKGSGINSQVNYLQLKCCLWSALGKIYVKTCLLIEITRVYMHVHVCIGGVWSSHVM